MTFGGRKQSLWTGGFANWSLTLKTKSCLLNFHSRRPEKCENQQETKYRCYNRIRCITFFDISSEEDRVIWASAWGGMWKCEDVEI